MRNPGILFLPHIVHLWPEIFTLFYVATFNNRIVEQWTPLQQLELQVWFYNSENRFFELASKFTQLTNFSIAHHNCTLKSNLVWNFCEKIWLGSRVRAKNHFLWFSLCHNEFEQGLEAVKTRYEYSSEFLVWLCGTCGGPNELSLTQISPPQAIFFKNMHFRANFSLFFAKIHDF